VTPTSTQTKTQRRILQGRKNSEEAQEYRVKKNNEVGEAKIRVRGTGNGNKECRTKMHYKPLRAKTVLADGHGVLAKR
jgi:hypothetical protein